MVKKAPQDSLKDGELLLKQKEGELEMAREKVSKTVEEIILISSSRHTANSEDTDVKYLTELETKYTKNNDTRNRNKTRSIIITPEHILIAGYKLDRFDVEMPKNYKDGLYNRKGHTLFSYEAAVKQSEITGRQAPSLDQWKEILDAIPGYSKEDKFNNMHKILNITFICPDDDYLSELAAFYYAQAPKDDEKNISDTNAGHYIILREGKLLLFNDGCRNGVSIRTIRK